MRRISHPSFVLLIHFNENVMFLIIINRQKKKKLKIRERERAKVKNYLQILLVEHSFELVGCRRYLLLERDP